jgi:hypothetical protein
VLQGILSTRLFTMLVIMALATTAMTGPLFHYFWLRHQGTVAPEIYHTGDNYLALDASLDSPLINNADNVEMVASADHSAGSKDATEHKDSDEHKGPGAPLQVVEVAF